MDGEVVVEGQVRGYGVFDNRELDDLIIAQKDGISTYIFSVIVDDYYNMRMTHVIRRSNHLNNTSI